MKLYNINRFKQILTETFKEKKWKHKEGSSQEAVVMDFINLIIHKLSKEGEKK